MRMQLILGGIAAVLGVLALSVGASAQEETRVSAKAVEVERNGDDYVRVDVSVESVEDLGGFEFVMSWGDELLLDVNDPAAIERTEFLGSSGREVYCETPVLEPFAVRYACVTLGEQPREGASGDGVLASIFLKPQGDGEAAIQFSHAQLATPPGDVIPTDWEAGEVAVTSDDSGSPMWMFIGIGAIAALGVVGGAGALFMRRRRPREEQFAG